MLNKTIEDFSKIILKFKEVLELEKDEVIRDSAIKRFELCFDLAWKAIKRYAKTQGVECYSPRECFKEGYQLKLLDYDDKWTKMIEDRNLSVHLYNEKSANEIYERFGDYLAMFEELLQRLQNNIKSE